MEPILRCRWHFTVLALSHLRYTGSMRPVGVTLSAYFQFVRAALLVLWAMAIMFVSGMVSRLAALATEGNAVQRFLAGFGRFLFAALLIYALIMAVLGFGLLLAQDWARALTIVVSGLRHLDPAATSHPPPSSVCSFCNSQSGGFALSLSARNPRLFRS